MEFGPSYQFLHEANSNSDQNSDVSFKAPHHFVEQIENHYVSQLLFCAHFETLNVLV